MTKNILLLAVLLGGLVSARADDPPPGHALLEEARFLDAVAGDYARAEAAYAKALEGRIGGSEAGEAQFGRGRALLFGGRRDQGVRVMESLAERSGEAALAPWPRLARRVLDRVANGDEPFDRNPRGQGVFSVAAVARPLEDVLRELGKEARVGVAFDENLPSPWTVSVDLRERPLEELFTKIVGGAGWRRVGDGMAVGASALLGSLFERRVPLDSLKGADERATAGLLATRRTTLTLPGVPLVTALEKLNAVSPVKIEADRAVLEGRARTVRAYLLELKLDNALDLLTGPLGLEWTVDGRRVVLRVRKTASGD